MEKFLNIKLSDGSVTPVRISGVSVIKFAADVGTGATLQTGGANTVFIPSAAGQKTEFVRALYQKIIEAIATPWNLPVIGGDDGWDYSVEPSSSQASSYAAQGDGGGGANFAAKQSAALQGTGSSSTGDVSPMLSVSAV